MPPNKIGDVKFRWLTAARAFLFCQFRVFRGQKTAFKITFERLFDIFALFNFNCPPILNFIKINGNGFGIPFRGVQAAINNDKFPLDFLPRLNQDVLG